MLARRGRRRKPTPEEAVALFESAVTTLEEAGIPIRVANYENGRKFALVVIPGRWRPARRVQLGCGQDMADHPSPASPDRAQD